MSEKTQKLLETESQAWVQVFMKQWEILKKEDPKITFEESVQISIRLRSFTKKFFTAYARQVSV